jgi:hypothetical protein
MITAQRNRVLVRICRRWFERRWFERRCFGRSFPLLRHVEQDEPHILVGDSGANAHVAENGCHHAWRKFLRSGVTAPAIGAEPLLALHPHGIGVVRADSWGGGRRILPASRFCPTGIVAAEKGGTKGKQAKQDGKWLVA